MTEARDHPRFGKEALRDRGMHREIGVHHLHRHRAIKRGVAREEDDAHPAMPQLGLEPILGPEGRLEAGGKLVRTGHGVLPMSRLGPGAAVPYRGVGLPGPHLVIHGQDMDGAIGGQSIQTLDVLPYPKVAHRYSILKGMGMT